MQKILIVSRSTIYQNKSGGMETQLSTLVEGLKKTFDVTILTTAKYSSQKCNLVTRRLGVKYIFLKNTIPGKNGYSMYENLFWQIPIKFKFNLLNTDFRKAASIYFSKKLKGEYKLIVSQSSACQYFTVTEEKIFSIYHGTTLNEVKNRYKGVNGIKGYVRFVFLDFPSLIFEYKIRNPQFFSKCYKIILVSDSLKKDFCDQHKAYSSKCVVIQNGVNTDIFKMDLSKFSFKKLNIVYYGRIDFEKGILDFLNIAEKIPNSNFFIFGDGPNRKDLLNSIQNKNLLNVFYKGSVSNEQISKELSNMHIFLFLTKRKEGMSMSLLEALSSGLVVITTVSTSKISASDGYFVVNNPQEAVYKIKYLIENSNILKSSSRNASNYIKTNLSSKIMVDKYIKLLQG